MKAAEWLISQNPVPLGADNWPVEVAPNPDPQISLPVHQIALVVSGVHLLENLKLDELLSKSVQEFAFIMTPLKISWSNRLDCFSNRRALNPKSCARSTGKSAYMGRQRSHHR